MAWYQTILTYAIGLGIVGYIMREILRTMTGYYDKKTVEEKKKCNKNKK